MWNAGRRESTSTGWRGDRADRCDVGVLEPLAIGDTVRRVNMYRWLSGLAPVTDDPEAHVAMQACATMQDANPSLSHHPPMSWRCYTAEGASAAGRANLSGGYRSSAASIDGYMRDARTPSLGHRRWILNGSLGRIGIGYRGRSGCLGVFDGSGASPRTWAAYPNPGPVPSVITSQTWSVQGSLPGEDVQVTRLSDGESLPVEVELLRSGFGSGHTVAIHRTGWTPEVGERYRVALSGTRGRIEYIVEPINCP